MEIRHMVDGKIVSINGQPVEQEETKKPTKSKKVEIKIEEDDANTETQNGTDEG